MFLSNLFNSLSTLASSLPSLVFEFFRDFVFSGSKSSINLQTSSGSSSSDFVVKFSGLSTGDDKVLSEILLEVSDFSYIIPELFLITVVLGLFIYGTFMEKPRYNFGVSEEFMGVSLITLFFTLLLSVDSLCNSPRVLFESLIIFDSGVVFVKIFILFVAAVCLIVSSDYLKRSRLGCFEFFILILICTWSVMFFVSSLDLFVLFVSLEIQSICFYALVAMNRNSGYCAEAAIKYFILGAFTSGILIYGISMVYGATGTTNIFKVSQIVSGFDFSVLLESSDMTLNASTSPLVALNSKLLLGFFFIFVGLLFKVTAAPFHMWAPDVYEGAPFATVVYISTVPKIAVFFIFAKFIGFYFLSLEFLWKYLFVFSGGLSVVVGTFFAIRQYKVKRFLAYSSITHMGYILLGLSTGTFEGIKFTSIYVVVYVLTLLNMWSLITLMENNYGCKIDSLLDFGGIFYKNKVIGWNLIVTLFSLSGLPPFVGFFAKYFLLFSLVHSSMYVVAFLVICSSLFSIFYYAKVVKIIIYDSKIKLLASRTSAGFGVSLVSSLSLLLLLVFYEIPLVHSLSESFVQSFFISF